VAKKILVIEDDADIRMLLKAQLGGAGYDTIGSRSPHCPLRDENL